MLPEVMYMNHLIAIPPLFFLSALYLYINLVSMTEKKLRDYLKKDFEQPRGQTILVPVVLSDSKGFRLKREVDSTVECSIF
jgi:hypothetical protein